MVKIPRTNILEIYFKKKNLRNIAPILLSLEFGDVNLSSRGKKYMLITVELGLFWLKFIYLFYKLLVNQDMIPRNNIL